MAYKFQLGAMIASGSFKAEDGIVGTDVDDATAANVVAQIDAGEIPIAKLAATTISGKALGTALDALSVDDSSIEFSAGSAFNGSAASAIRIKAAGVTNAMLAGSIANGKLSNSTISGKALGANLDALNVASNKGLSMSAFNGSAAVSDLQVVLDGNGGLEFNGGTGIRLEAAVAGAGMTHNAGVLAVVAAANGGLDVQANDVKLDFGGLTGADVAVASDSFAFWDADATAVRKESMADYAAAIAGDGIAASAGVLAVGVDASSIEINSDALRVKAAGITNAMLSGSIADSKFLKISSANKVDLAALDLDGGTDIGAALVDADLFIVDDGAGGTNRKATMARVSTYAKSKFSAATTGGKAEGSIAYNDGAYTFTQMSVAELRAHLSIADTNSMDMSYSGGQISADLRLGSAGALEIDSDGLDLKSTISGNRTFSGDLIVSGDLTVNGTNTILNTSTLEVEDLNIKVAKGAANSAAADGAGMTIEMGSDDVTFAWNHAGDQMQIKKGASFANIRANKFIGDLEGAVAQAITAHGDADRTLVVGFNYGNADTTALRTWTLPASPELGQVVHVKAPAAVHADGIKILKAGSQTVDGVDFITLESPFAAVNLMYVANNLWRVY